VTAGFGLTTHPATAGPNTSLPPTVTEIASTSLRDDSSVFCSAMSATARSSWSPGCSIVAVVTPPGPPGMAVRDMLTSCRRGQPSRCAPLGRSSRQSRESRSSRWNWATKPRALHCRTVLATLPVGSAEA
jgi:hypothetical protein